MPKFVLGLAGVVLAAIAAAAYAAGPPPPPTATNGHKVVVVGAGVPTPTSFAFGQGNVFVSAFGSEDGKTPGGIYVLRSKGAVKLKGLTGASELAWRSGTLYATITPTGQKLMAYSGWNGSTFTKKRVVWTGPKGFPGLNGLAIGPDGRIYAGVSLTNAGDHKKVNKPYANSVIALRTDGTDVKTVATGLRQPWQIAFAPGIATPFVTVLERENLGKKRPPDYIVEAKSGDDYGFPGCIWSKPSTCASFAKPFALFPAHSSPTGIAAHGSTLYVAVFNGTGHGPEVVTIPARGGARKPFLTGFAAPVVAVGAAGPFIWAGDLTGQIYRVRR